MVLGLQLIQSQLYADYLIVTRVGNLLGDSHLVGFGAALTGDVDGRRIHSSIAGRRTQSAMRSTWWVNATAAGCGP